MSDLQIGVSSLDVLKQINEFLKENSIRLPRKGMKLGRSESVVNEAQVIKKIREEFNIITLDNIKDPWSDFFGHTLERDYFPVNIKISSLGTADNTCGKIPIAYVFTNTPTEKMMNKKFLSSINSYSSFLKFFEENISLVETGKDYYFLIIDKSQTTNVFYTSLRGLKTVVPNGNNLPFQCHWNKNIGIVNRTYEESLSFVLKHYLASIEKSPILKLRKTLIGLNERFVK